MTITFTVPGRIVGKGRPKFFRKGDHVGVYTPAKTRNNEALVRSMASDAMHGSAPLEGALFLDMRVRLIPPKSWSKKKRASTVFATGKPDLDNVLKLVGDSLNGICWADDAQISAVFTARTYDCNQPECVVVTIGRLDDSLATIERPVWAPAEMPLFQGVAA